MKTLRAAVVAVGVALAMSGCSPADSEASGPSTSAPAASPSTGALVPSGSPTTVVDGLESPWSMVPLDDGSTLISERDTGVVEELKPDGSLRAAGKVAGVVHQGEGGLLGLAVLGGGVSTSSTNGTSRANDDERWLYAYLTTASDNRIVRMPLVGSSGTYSLGTAEVVLKGLARAGNHDGGRIAFGPDGMLYATVGDAGVPARAQDPRSLNGKILRMTPTGGVPAGNPTSDSLVYSMGHRNPQGIAWDASGQLYAAEFGQDTWDEFNRIEAGGNYGWPTVEGKAGKAGFIDPLVQWATDDASPSGLAFVDGTFYLASLKGQRLWAITVGSGTTVASETTATAYLTGTLGRLRDVAAGPGSSLWILTNNTDGRGDPKPGDDRIAQLGLTRAP